MTASTCAVHPGAAVRFRCDGCGERLCADCVDEGHRLLFCRRCGERALPLDASEAASVPARRRQAARRAAASYRFTDALAYPFRGYGAFAFWGYLVALAGVGVLVLLLGGSPIAGLMISGFAGGILGLLLAAYLFAIARSTADGDDELPDWPDFDFWPLIGRLLLSLAVTAFSLLPLALLAWIVGCGPGELLAGGGACLAAVAAGLAAAPLLWVPAFGATAVYDTPWLFFRADLHLRAAAVAPRELLIAAGLAAGLFAASRLLSVLVAAALPVPILGGLLGDGLAVYGLFVAAHLAGVYFRRHRDPLDAVYLG